MNTRIKIIYFVTIQNKHYNHPCSVAEKVPASVWISVPFQTINTIIMQPNNLKTMICTNYKGRYKGFFFDRFLEN